MALPETKNAIIYDMIKFMWSSFFSIFLTQLKNKVNLIVKEKRVKRLDYSYQPSKDYISNNLNIFNPSSLDSPTEATN